MPNRSITPRTFTNFYCVWDKVANELFGSIIRAPNHEVARRSFHDLLSLPDSPVANHKGDYDLLFLGKIDNMAQLYDEDGTAIGNGPDVVAIGQDWVDANNKENTK